MTKIQLKQSAYPEFKYDSTEFEKDGMNITFLNIGQKATLVNVVDKGKTFDIMPMTISNEKSNRLVLFCKYKTHKPMKGEQYTIYIHYKDIYDNPYKLVVTGNGEFITSWSTSEVLN